MTAREAMERFQLTEAQFESYQAFEECYRALGKRPLFTIKDDYEPIKKVQP